MQDLAIRLLRCFTEAISKLLAAWVDVVYAPAHGLNAACRVLRNAATGRVRGGLRIDAETAWETLQKSHKLHRLDPGVVVTTSSDQPQLAGVGLRSFSPWPWLYSTFNIIRFRPACF